MRRLAGWLLITIFVFQFALIVAILAATTKEPWAWALAALILLAEGIVLMAHIRISRRVLSPEHVPVDVAPRSSRQPPMPAVQPVDLADVPEPVTACPDCGFLGIRMPGIGDRLWPGGGETGSRIVCPRCDYQGIAVSFDTRTEYGEFLRALEEDRKVA